MDDGPCEELLAVRVEVERVGPETIELVSDLALLLRTDRAEFNGLGARGILVGAEMNVNVCPAPRIGVGVSVRDDQQLLGSRHHHTSPMAGSTLLGQHLRYNVTALLPLSPWAT